MDRTDAGNLTSVDGAAMLTTRGYLPADSSYEVRMADHSIAAGRPVLKPLRYDSHNDIFPDFVLLDTDPPTFVELWGVPGRTAYEARRKAKHEHVAATQNPSLEWEITGPPAWRDGPLTAKSLPSFVSARRRWPSSGFGLQPAPCRCSRTCGGSRFRPGSRSLATVASRSDSDVTQDGGDARWPETGCSSRTGP
ncbi:DUF1173 domain-containing protein [Pseudonocardia kujensis]|uniref:DUF1173 family protein n=1 Tax=Pseudonocardia kujensis TaxID=1128675 RepID=UPI001E542853|nr:DUF1173 family protein [Pseudonocardia kujensis]MCE0767389.1 DUF1173 domain-containing protein [Pseudonocardia kujensis]